jgi:hypothetical protein
VQFNPAVCKVGVPKTDGGEDYHWNLDGAECVPCVMTANVDVAYVVGRGSLL